MASVTDVIAWAQQELGQPYVFGGEEPGGFDCSGLMQYIFAKVGISLPRTAAAQQSWATPVTSPSPGDLVFYGRPAHHVALYVGAGRVIQAPHTGARVSFAGVGSPTSYGRVPGLGLSSVVSSALAPVSFLNPSSWLGDARNLVYTGLFVVFALGLVTYGTLRIARPSSRRLIGELR